MMTLRSSTTRTRPTPAWPARRSRPSRPRVSVVVPAMDEACNLELLLPLIDPAHEVVVVSGRTPGRADDETHEVVERLRPGARTVRQTRAGKGNALVCGFAEATGDILVTFDADGSADHGEIPRFVAALVAGADYVKGTRYADHGGSADLTPIRSLGNLALTAAANALFGGTFSDLCYGYNALWADVVPLLGLPAPYPAGAEPVWGDGFEIEALLHCRAAAHGLRVAEVPSYELTRMYGDSNLHAVRDGLRVARTLLLERRLAARGPAPAVDAAGPALGVAAATDVATAPTDTRRSA